MSRARSAWIRRAVALAAGTALLSSCGIRVSHSDVVKAAGGSGDFAVDRSATGPGDAQGTTDTTLATGAGTGAGSTVSGASAAGTKQGSGAVQGGGAAAKALVMGHGVTASTIEIGFAIQDKTMSAALAAGGSPGNAASDGARDQAQVIDAVVKYVNAHGGIVGRKVVPVTYQIHTSNSLSASGRQQETQNACATWTQDHKVAAFGITDQQLDFSVIDCAARSDTVYVQPNAALPPLPDALFGKYGKYWYAPGMPSAERSDATVCNGLADQKFFGPGAKVAIMAYDHPWVTGPAAALKSCLTSRGVNVATQINYPDNVDSPWSNYVLQMQTDHVTHVVWTGTQSAGLAISLFMKAAESQMYRPRYGGGSDMYPAALGPKLWNSPTEQLKNVVEVGWRPFIDTGEAVQPSSTGTICQQIITGAGLPTSWAFENAYCEGLFFVKAAFEKAPALNTEGFAQGVANLGTSFVNTISINGSSRFASNRHGGTSLVRNARWSDADQRFAYFGAPYPAS
jgi:hypothetical protein